MRAFMISCFAVLAGCSKNPSVSASSSLAETVSTNCDTVAADWRPPLLGQCSERLDSSETVANPSDRNSKYYRSRFAIWFSDSLSGPEACRLLERHKARITAGVRGALGAASYTIAVPDPGADWSAWQALLARLSAEPGFQHAYGIRYGGKFRVPPEG